MSVILQMQHVKKEQCTLVHNIEEYVVTIYISKDLVAPMPLPENHQNHDEEESYQKGNHQVRQHVAHCDDIPPVS